MHLDSFCTPLSFQYVAESGGIKIKLNYSNPLPTTGVTFLKNITIHKTYHYSPAPSMRMSRVTASAFFSVCIHAAAGKTGHRWKNTSTCVCLVRNCFTVSLRSHC
jgi:hypothetical protein